MCRRDCRRRVKEEDREDKDGLIRDGGMIRDGGRKKVKRRGNVELRKGEIREAAY